MIQIFLIDRVKLTIITFSLIEAHEIGKSQLKY